MPLRRKSHGSTRARWGSAVRNAKKRDKGVQKFACDDLVLAPQADGSMLASRCCVLLDASNNSRQS